MYGNKNWFIIDCKKRCHKKKLIFFICLMCLEKIMVPKKSGCNKKLGKLQYKNVY